LVVYNKLFSKLKGWIRGNPNQAPCAAAQGP
jgi:hypothetical protein